MRLVIMLVAIRGCTASEERFHFRIVVPEFINTHTHTKTVYVLPKKGKTLEDGGLATALGAAGGGSAMAAYGASTGTGFGTAAGYSAVGPSPTSAAGYGPSAGSATGSGSGGYGFPSAVVQGTPSALPSTGSMLTSYGHSSAQRPPASGPPATSATLPVMFPLRASPLPPPPPPGTIIVSAAHDASFAELLSHSTRVRNALRAQRLLRGYNSAAHPSAVGSTAVPVTQMTHTRLQSHRENPTLLPELQTVYDYYGVNSGHAFHPSSTGYGQSEAIKDVNCNHNHGSNLVSSTSSGTLAPLGEEEGTNDERGQNSHSVYTTPQTNVQTTPHSSSQSHGHGYFGSASPYSSYSSFTTPQTVSVNQDHSYNAYSSLPVPPTYSAGVLHNQNNELNVRPTHAPIATTSGQLTSAIFTTTQAYPTASYTANYKNNLRPSYNGYSGPTKYSLNNHYKFGSNGHIKYGFSSPAKYGATGHSKYPPTGPAKYYPTRQPKYIPHSHSNLNNENYGQNSHSNHGFNGNRHHGSNSIHYDSSGKSNYGSTANLNFDSNNNPSHASNGNLKYGPTGNSNHVSNNLKFGSSSETNHLSNGNVKFGATGDANRLSNTIKFVPTADSNRFSNGNTKFSSTGDSNQFSNGNLKSHPTGNSNYLSNGNVKYTTIGNTNHVSNGNLKYRPTGNSNYLSNSNVKFTSNGDSSYVPNGNLKYVSNSDSNHAPHGNAHSNSNYAPNSNFRHGPRVKANTQGIHGSNGNSNFVIKTHPVYGPSGSTNYASHNKIHGSQVNSNYGTSESPIYGTSENPNHGLHDNSNYLYRNNQHKHAQYNSYGKRLPSQYETQPFTMADNPRHTPPNVHRTPQFYQVTSNHHLPSSSSVVTQPEDFRDPKDLKYKNEKTPFVKCTRDEKSGLICVASTNVQTNSGNETKVFVGDAWAKTKHQGLPKDKGVETITNKIKVNPNTDYDHEDHKTEGDEHTADKSQMSAESASSSLEDQVGDVPPVSEETSTPPAEAAILETGDYSASLTTSAYGLINSDETPEDQPVVSQEQGSADFKGNQDSQSDRGIVDTEVGRDGDASRSELKTAGFHLPAHQNDQWTPINPTRLEQDDSTQDQAGEKRETKIGHYNIKDFTADYHATPTPLRSTTVVLGINRDYKPLQAFFGRQVHVETTPAPTQISNLKYGDMLWSMVRGNVGSAEVPKPVNVLPTATATGEGLKLSNGLGIDDHLNLVNGWGSHIDGTEDALARPEAFPEDTKPADISSEVHLTTTSPDGIALYYQNEEETDTQKSTINNAGTESEDVSVDDENHKESQLSTTIPTTTTVRFRGRVKYNSLMLTTLAPENDDSGKAKMVPSEEVVEEIVEGVADDTAEAAEDTTEESHEDGEAEGTDKPGGLLEQLRKDVETTKDSLQNVLDSHNKKKGPKIISETGHILRGLAVAEQLEEQKW